MAKEKDEELQIMKPTFGFYLVTVEIQAEDSETGKVKKVKEVHLVDGCNLQDINQKVSEEMDGTMYDWKITKCVQSGVQFVY